MRKVYYEYDPKAKIYRRIFPTFWQRLLTITRRIVLFVVFGGLSFFIYYIVLETPETTKELQAENSRLLAQYKVLSHRLDDAMEILNDIQQRDDNLYRVMLMAEPVSSAIRTAGYGGTNRYEELMSLKNTELVVNTTQKMDMLTKQLYIQSKSFDEVVEFFKNHEDMLNHIPAIQPVPNKDLKRTASGYGYRMDPIYHTRRFHEGMDFSCNQGVSVYATADGVVKSAKWESGYGQCVTIDHGYGYQTLYAHLKSFQVKKGQKVVRGEQIGLVGNTGKSTGPHLHYEVIVRGKKVNPVNYYFMDLDAEQYETIVQLAENHGKVLD